jgi:predicted PurR-regulated permease PerM
MIEVQTIKPGTRKYARISYLFMLVILVVTGWMHLGTLVLATLFSYLALNILHFTPRLRKWLVVLFFLVLVCGISYAMGHFANMAVRALPEIAEKSVPQIIKWAKSQNIQLPFSDYDSLREFAMGTVTSETQYLGRFANFAHGATIQFVFLIAGIAVAISIFLDSRLILDPPPPGTRTNVYVLCCEAIAERFRALYKSFATVIGAQIVISAINTVLTALFVLIVGLPYAVVLIGATFLCGLLPVIGNLMSNTIIIGVAFTISPQAALEALIFLVVIHKLEYFLNSKIIGHRIKNPLWLTLLALLLGERVMGIPGMILAPVVLNYLRVEASRIEVEIAPDPAPATSSDDAKNVVK